MKKIILSGLLCCLLIGKMQANIITDPIVNSLKFATWWGVGAVVPVISGYYGGKVGESVCNALSIERPEIGMFYADKIIAAGLGLGAAFYAKRAIHKGDWIPTLGLTAGFTCGAPVLMAGAYLIHRFWPGNTAVHSTDIAASHYEVNPYVTASAYDEADQAGRSVGQSFMPQIHAQSLVGPSAYDYLFSRR